MDTLTFFLSSSSPEEFENGSKRDPELEDYGEIYFYNCIKNTGRQKHVAKMEEPE